jgi:hypothetical protein
MATKTGTKKASTKAAPAAPLTDREKRILVSLRKSGVESCILSSAFGVSNMSIAAYTANATRGSGCFA